MYDSPPLVVFRGQDRMGRHAAVAELRRGGAGRPRWHRHRDAANLRQRDEDRARQVLAGRDVARSGGHVHTGAGLYRTWDPRVALVAAADP